MPPVGLALGMYLGFLKDASLPKPCARSDLFAFFVGPGSLNFQVFLLLVGPRRDSGKPTLVQMGDPGVLEGYTASK